MHAENTLNIVPNLLQRLISGFGSYDALQLNLYCSNDIFYILDYR